MGWEQRGNNRYYYKKEREGSRVKSVYVGRGDVAQMVSKFQASSTDLEKLMQAKRSIEANELEHLEATLDRAIELTHLFTQAALLCAGFHTHHRQWRRKRNGVEY
jgi:predicted negative regulator of RcsB-dependent stress response